MAGVDGKRNAEFCIVKSMTVHACNMLPHLSLR